VSLEVQVAEFVTSVLPFAALNCTLCVLVKLKGPVGTDEIVNDCPPAPVTLPVAEPLTPATLAVMVTLETAATPRTVPAFTGAHGLELCQAAELVTSLFPPSL
jgi:hypothetical protein